MLEIDLWNVFIVLRFLGVWLVCYLVLLLARFGDDINWKTELIAAVVAIILPVLLFTNLVKFSW